MSETPGQKAAGGAQQISVVATELEAVVKSVPQSAIPGGLNKGRLVAGLGALAGIAAALAPALANLDITSTVGVIGGVGALAAAVVKWLDGWQKYEADVRDPTKFNEPAP